MVRPIITYGAIAWWNKTNEITTRVKLQKIQRLACLTTLGCSRSTPIAAMEALLSLPPLHLFIQNEAMSTNCRYKISEKKEINCLEDESLRDLYSFKEDLIYALEHTDQIDKIYNFDFPYKIEFPSREDWEKTCFDINEEIDVWYTDGSKSPYGVGSGIFDSKNHAKYQIAHHKDMSVFQAELLAINECAEINLRKNTNKRNIHIYSDSKSALQSLNSNIISSKTVNTTVKNLKNLCKKNTVTLKWIPAHSNYYGNEMADQLATNANFYNEPQTNAFIPKTKIKSALKEILFKRAIRYWIEKGRMIHSRLFIKRYNSTKTRELLSLKRKELWVVTGFLTGHFPVKYMLKKKKIINEDNCRFCESCKETDRHILCECLEISLKRFMYFGRAIVSVEKIKRMPFSKIYNFISSLELL
jgi:ribonuclease HI